MHAKWPPFFSIPAHRRIRDDLQCNVREGNACHQAATWIVGGHGLTAVEKLKIRKLTRSAGRIAEKPGSQGKADAGPNWEIAAQNWSLLQSQLEYKAAWAGREMAKVTPRYTSPDSYRCGARNDPDRSNTFRCGCCGPVADRDVNSAVNIPAAGVPAAGASTRAVGPCVAPELCAGAT